MSQHLAIAQVEPNGPMVKIRVPTPAVGPGELLLETRAAGINPADQKWFDLNPGRLTRDQYPWLTGCDITGVVVKVGDGVTSFKEGDKVVTFQAPFLSLLGNRVAGLQKYSIASAKQSAKIPDGVTFQEAATFPVTAVTIIAAFQGLGIQWPAVGPMVSNEPVIVWGGGAGVGRTAIIFLKKAGYNNIIVTAALKRAADLKAIGARVVIDYRDEQVAQKLLEAKGNGKILIAIDATGRGGSTDIIANLMEKGGRIAVGSLPTGAKHYQKLDVIAFPVNCAKYINPSPENVQMRSFGETIVWPAFQKLLVKGYPFQPQLIVNDGSSNDIGASVNRAFDIIRTSAGDGRKVVVNLEGQLN
ncbi:chaperonin 10-like protein [Xylogone sp. PMI_703]|nr:chaperonin 10-like protein [Xylogone sp. PMI_703]